VSGKPEHSMLKPSTRAFLQEARRTDDYSFFDSIHGYVYARWPYLYIGIGTGEHRLSKIIVPMINAISAPLKRWKPADPDVEQETFADGYHGKVMPIESAKRLVMVKEEIVIKDLERVLPYPRARDIILQNPENIVALECPCRSVRENPCLPLDVCLIVGDPMASFIHEHQPERSRQITQVEAAAILDDEHQRGHVHHAFFKDAMLGRYYAICNCCSCCCGAMQAFRNGTPMLTSSGYVAKVDLDLCIVCGNCVETCSFAAMELENDQMVVDENLCMGCGVCVANCEQSALVLERDASKGEPLEIQELLAQVERAAVLER
jgi:ferredoxin